jgi:hypothetical protein
MATKSKRNQRSVNESVADLLSYTGLPLIPFGIGTTV